MPVNSWMRLAAPDPRHALPEAIAELDPMAARDCGWVEQMTPFIRAFCPRDGWVIDPFCGFGSTLVAATVAGVPAAGVEVDPRRVSLTQKRLALLGADAVRYPVIAGNVAHAHTRDALHVAQDNGRVSRRFDLCLTNVPYFGCPGIDASPHGADTSEADRRAGRDAVREVGQLYGSPFYAHYLDGLRDVFVGVEALLEPDAWCVVMVQNLRLAGGFVPLAWDVARLLGERFVMHEERIIVYDKPVTATYYAPGAERPTNRAHEYALICRKSSRCVDDGEAQRLLRALSDAGFAYLLCGSFGQRLLGESGKRPNDIDLVCPPDDAEVSRLVMWLEAAGFRIESWNAPVSAPVSLGVLGYRHYFRARRVDAQGATLQLDITVAADRAVFDGLAAGARRVAFAGLDALMIAPHI